MEPVRGQADGLDWRACILCEHGGVCCAGPSPQGRIGARVDAATSYQPPGRPAPQDHYSMQAMEW